MINARRGLVSTVRGFFETEIGDLFRFDDAVMQRAEPAKPQANGRPGLEGKHRELVVFGFGDFRLEVASPSDEPPLGIVRLYRHETLLAQGPLDVATWQRVGLTIRENCHAIA